MNDTLELIDLESLLNDECKCNAGWHYGNTCMVHVVAMMSFACEPSYRPSVCATLVSEYHNAVALKEECADCGQLIRDCWSIVPV